MIVKSIHESVKIPRQATDGSAGFDISAFIDKPVILKPGAFEKIPTGLIFFINHGYVGLLMPRSGLSMSNINLANGVGVIDSDYHHELMVLLKNNGTQPFKVVPGARIAQMLITSVYMGELDGTSTNNAPCPPRTQRQGGFGSTGV